MVRTCIRVVVAGIVMIIAGLVWMYGPLALIVCGALAAGGAAFLIQVGQPIPDPPYDETEHR